MNKQAVLDKLWQTFVVEGKPLSVDTESSVSACVYHRKDGASCGVGIFDTKGLITEGYEGLGVGDLPDGIVEALFPGVGEGDMEFLHNVQRAHDGAAGMFTGGPNGPWKGSIRTNLSRLAGEYGLRVPAEAPTSTPTASKE